MGNFAHLHVHTQFSILDGAASIANLIAKAKSDGMEALAITDHGNMYGVLHFIEAAEKEGIKPIIGCEVYVAHTSRFDKKAKDDRSGYHLILLAKNLKGYLNLSKLVTLAYKDGFYYTPRIDKELLIANSEGLIGTTACLGGELPKAILRGNMEYAEKLTEDFLKIFGEDFYFELMRHGIEDQKIVNEGLLKLSKKFNIKCIATNDIHYVNRDDFEAHHILICLNTGKDSDDKDGMKYSGEEFFKTTAEMEELFKDIPEAISNTQEIVRKVEKINLKRDVILPVFPIPESFSNENEFLSHLTFEGAIKRYNDVSESIKARLDFELSVILKMGFAGYFLIVQDFINEAKKMGVIVGPGRGSAAGSAVAYCIGITNIDPIKYNLLFERFLNPERVSMPDMDIDFDDYGREKVIEYVVNKYGYDRVAQIVTFGSMAARSSIRDVARVLKLPLPEADRLAKLVPKDAKTLKEAFKSVIELEKERESGDLLVQKTLKFAEILEGSARNTGTHACGIIIGKNDLIDHIPLSVLKDAKLMVTQFEGSQVEKVGMLKMDFLGLKTLTIIKDALEIIKQQEKTDIDLDTIPLEDELTWELFKNGNTVGIFQFESEGMRNQLKNLKPNNIEDLIAMNALYRPGPLEFIPTFINRKHGKEEVIYPHPLLEGILKPTYGIMVYQEQIMQCAQIIGNLSLGKADVLRRAMGKKKADEMHKMKAEFVAGAKGQNISEEKATYIFEIMEKFANYGFNRSHAAAYSIIAYQTAYLKAHYPAPFMAAVLAHNMNEVKTVNFFIGECSRMGLNVLGPDVNESNFKFTVNKNGNIRFGLGAIKGLGEAAVESLISERTENGFYSDLFNLTSRVNLRTVNKRCVESLANSGAFDSFQNNHRAQYFYTEPNEDQNTIDKAIRYGQKIKEFKVSVQQSLFGDSGEFQISVPQLPDCEPWSTLDLLKKEKEHIGFYISGHPLDDYKFDLDHFTNTTLEELNENIEKFLDKTFRVAGLVLDMSEKYNKNGEPFGVFVIEDYNSNSRFVLFKEKYLKFRHLLSIGTKLFIQGTVKQRYNSKELMMDIIDITLLTTIREKMLKNITIQIDLAVLNRELSNNLVNLVLGNPGKHRVFLDFLESNGNGLVNLLLSSQKLLINPSNVFFEKLESIEGIKYSIN